MAKQQHNALILFCRTPDIVRDNMNSPFAALPWEDIDTLFTAFVGDLLMTVSHLEGTDVLIYRNPEELSDDFFLPFRQMVQLIDINDEPFSDQVEHAIDSAFQINYTRVVVLLDNDPAITADFLDTAFDQLGYEDDCMVMYPTSEGRSALIGMNTNHSKIFDSAEGDPITKPHLLLQRVCTIDTHLFLTKPGKSLDTAGRLEALKQEIEHRGHDSPYFPSRSSKAFAMLEKKYSRRRGTR